MRQPEMRKRSRKARQEIDLPPRSRPGRNGDERARGPGYTGEILNFLHHAHGHTRVDSKGDYFYDNVSAISLHFLLRTGLPCREILWQWYQHFDQERSESIYQTLPPQRDEELLEVLERCEFPWDASAVRASGLIFLQEHRRLIYMMIEDFLSERLDAYHTMSDAELRAALEPTDTWSEQHIARLVQQLQTQPLPREQRRMVYDQLDSGYLRATARQMMDRMTSETFWRHPPPELEELESQFIAFVRQMTAEARRLGVYVSRAEFEQQQGRRYWEQAFGRAGGRRRRAQGRVSGRRMQREAHFATLGLPPSASLSEVKSAYREMVKLHHPDQGGTVQDFIRLQEAYEFLLTEVF